MYSVSQENLLSMYQVMVYAATKWMYCRRYEARELMPLLHQSCTDNYSIGVPIQYLNVTIPTVSIGLLPYIPLHTVVCRACVVF